MKLQDISTSGNSDFFVIQPGENKLRLVSEFEERFVHWDAEANRSISVKSIDDLRNGEEPRRRYIAYAIDRADGQIKMLEVGASVIKQLQELQASDDYKFDSIPAYDLTIKKTGQKLDTRYNLIPARENSELTTEETLAIEELQSLFIICELFIAKSTENADGTMPDPVGTVPAPPVDSEPFSSEK
jgi:hypothetical protein